MSTPDATAPTPTTSGRGRSWTPPAPGLAYRVLQFEYDGALGGPWLHRRFTPHRFRAAVVGTDWQVADVERGSGE